MAGSSGPGIGGGGKSSSTSGASSAAGIHGSNTSGGWAGYFEGPVKVTGNISQPPYMNGMVKATLLVRKDGTIELCYNSQLNGAAATTPPCGISINHAGTGTYEITFPFQVNTRFYSVTIADTTNLGFKDGAAVRPFAPQAVRVITYFPSGYVDVPFYLLVF